MLGIIEGLISIAKDLVSIAESICKHSNKEKRLTNEQVVSLIRDYAKDIVTTALLYNCLPLRL